MLQIAALLVTVTAVFAYLNHRFIRLPTTIGVMGISLVFSLAIVALGRLGLPAVAESVEAVFRAVDFNEVLMQGMLSLLLFAGALHVDLEELAARKWSIGLLATAGVVISTALVGVGAWLLFGALGVPLAFAYCLVFGALISPTDPIAVLSVLKSAGASKGLEIKIAGESLFNDGIAVVVFIVLAGIAGGSADASFGHIALLFAEEALGGILYGLLIGYVCYRMLKSIDSYQVEVLLTLALVLGGYTLASRLHVSGPLAMVVAGLMIGNSGRSFAMSETTREHLDTFWELVDEVLNAVLFVMIGFEVVVLTFEQRYFFAALATIPLVLLARFVAVGVPITLLRRRLEFSPHAVKILTWGGVRGGISVALALSLPGGPEREAILFVTYVVVVFSILVQGLSLSRVIERLAPSGDALAAASG